MPKVIALYRRFNHRIRVGFGIGTNLMNDLGPTPLNIVVKMVRANGQPVAKISDTPGKGMCEDETYLAYLRQVFGLDSWRPRRFFQTLMFRLRNVAIGDNGSVDCFLRSADLTF